jgi:phosphoribosylformylglycinamidine cyclo-ligase
MLRTFNCGIGMIVVVQERDAKAAITTLRKTGENVVVLGHIAPRKGGEPQVRYLGQLD